MQHVVDSYQCEWKTAVTTPDVRQRFRTFVNSDKADGIIVFVEERGQIRPARPDERPAAATGDAARARHHPPESPAMSIEPSSGPPCAVDDILPDTGVCAWRRAARGGLPGRHVAVLRHRQRGPQVRRQRLSRGWSATWASTWWSPRRSTRTTSTSADGVCLEAPEHSVRAHSVRVEDGQVARAGPILG